MKTLSPNERARLRALLDRDEEITVVAHEGITRPDGPFVTFYAKGTRLSVEIELEEGARDERARKWQAFGIGERERMRGVRGQLG